MTPTQKGHLTNRRVFASLDREQPILRLYCKLVALELSLKDFDLSNFSRRHDVCDMAVSTFTLSSSVAAAAATLSGDLSNIFCSNPQGAPSLMRSDKYPDLRYVRMDSDFMAPCSTEADIVGTLNSLDTLLQELQKEGLPWP